MNNLKYTLFDLFVYTLPGALLLFSGYVVYFGNDKHFSSQTIGSIFSNLNIYEAAIFIIFSYCCGFVCSIIGYYFWRLKELFFPIFKKDEEPKSKSKKFATVRELSKENFKYIEQWNVLKNFASALSVVLLVIDFLFFYQYNGFPVICFLIGMILSILILFQASNYHRWALIDLDNAYQFCLQEQSKQS